MTNLLRLAPLLAGLLLATGPGIPRAVAQSPRSASASRGAMALTVGEGRLMQLDHDAANVLIADPSVADIHVVSPRIVFLFGRKPGQTTLSATDADSGTEAQLILRVTRSAAAAQAALPTGVTAAFEFEGNRIVARGALSDLGQALDTSAAARAYNPGGGRPLDRTRLAGAQQITLRVRIAEASRTVVNQLGVNLNAMPTAGSFAFRLVTGGVLGAVAGTANTGLTTSLAGQNASTAFGQAGVISNGRVNASAFLNALESEGVVSTLAEPNLTTISGETAHFNAGGEGPIPVPQALGVTTIEYKQYGVQLSFTPVLLPGDRIALRVQPQVSELSFANSVSIGGTTVPAFISRSADTNVEMASGQTLAIAGLLQRSEQTSLAKFPFLGDIPVVGALFRSRSFQRDETELVILVTPYLSAPVSGQNAIPLPTDPAIPVAAPAAMPAPGAPLALLGGGFVVD